MKIKKIAGFLYIIPIILSIVVTIVLFRKGYKNVELIAFLGWGIGIIVVSFVLQKPKYKEKIKFEIKENKGIEDEVKLERECKRILSYLKISKHIGVSIYLLIIFRVFYIIVFNT